MNDPYGSRSLKMITLTSYILMRKVLNLFFVGKTIAQYGVHSFWDNAKNWFYKIMECWFYTIFATRLSGRKEIAKNVKQVWFDFFILEFTIVHHVTSESNDWHVLHKAPLLFGFTKEMVFTLLTFGEAHIFSDFEN